MGDIVERTVPIYWRNCERDNTMIRQPHEMPCAINVLFDNAKDAEKWMKSHPMQVIRDRDNIYWRFNPVKNYIELYRDYHQKWINGSEWLHSYAPFMIMKERLMTSDIIYKVRCQGIYQDEYFYSLDDALALISKGEYRDFCFHDGGKTVSIKCCLVNSQEVTAKTNITDKDF